MMLRRRHYNSEFGFGKALKFDGVDDYGIIKANSQLNDLPVQFCVEFWFQRTGDQLSSYPRVLYKNSVGGKGGMIMTPSYAGISLYHYVGSQNILAVDFKAGRAPIELGEWVHMVFNVDTTSILNSHGYSNGIDRTYTQNGSGSDPNGLSAAQDIYIGVAPNLSNHARFGIDSLRFWNRHLTSSEASTIYNNGKGGFPPNTTGLLAEYAFDGDTNDSVAGNHMELHNITNDADPSMHPQFYDHI